MARVIFTANLERHVSCPVQEVRGATVRAALEEVFAGNARLRSYLLDDQGAVRQHVVLFLNERSGARRAVLDDALGPLDELHVFQALSGG